MRQGWLGWLLTNSGDYLDKQKLPNHSFRQVRRSVKNWESCLQVSCRTDRVTFRVGQIPLLYLSACNRPGATVHLIFNPTLTAQSAPPSPVLQPAFLSSCPCLNQWKQKGTLSERVRFHHNFQKSWALKKKTDRYDTLSQLQSPEEVQWLF